MVFDRVAGWSLLAAASVGYLVVADDLRHTGELVGVSALLVAGLLLLLARGADLRLLRRLPLRSMAAGIFPGILLGAGLDRMLLGVGIGLVSGAAAGLLFAARTSG